MSEDIYILKIYEPFGIDHKTYVRPVDDRPLEQVVGEQEQEGLAVSYISIDAQDIPKVWQTIIPKKGQTIAIFPKVGTKTFSNAYIEKLNANHTAGIFVKAVDVAVPTGPQRFVAWDRKITFEGNQYDPLHMEWGGLENDRSMTVPQMSVAVPNLHKTIDQWLEEIDIREVDVTFRLLHLDLLGDASAQDSFILQIQTIISDDFVAVFNCALTMSLEDHLPRGAIMKVEYPGIPENTQRILI